MSVVAPNRPPARERATSSRELWTWLFMRVSGLVLVLLVLGHFTIVHLLGGGIDRINFAFVSGRWSNPLWQTWDWLMLSLGLLHGANGVTTVVREYVHSPGRRTVIKAIVYLLTLIFLLLGTLVIVTFDPTKGHSALGALGAIH